MFSGVMSGIRTHGFCTDNAEIIYETIAENLQQVWASFLQSISQPHYRNLSFVREKVCTSSVVRRLGWVSKPSPLTCHVRFSCDKLSHSKSYSWVLLFAHLYIVFEGHTMSEKKRGYIPNYARFIMGGSAGWVIWSVFAKFQVLPDLQVQIKVLAFV